MTIRTHRHLRPRRVETRRASWSRLAGNGEGHGQTRKYSALIPLTNSMQIWTEPVRIRAYGCRGKLFVI
ncbi:hypothetical protein BSLA_03f0707 [Burkholderia stabilis]|nr:hypothetical protein BSLA_03f0707 [Burkholderia stabilis]